MSISSKHDAKILEILGRDFGASLMNNTLWSAVCQIVAPTGARVRAKLIYEDLPEEWITSGRVYPKGALAGLIPMIEISGGPIPFIEVEWLDVEPFRLVRRGRLVPDAKEPLDLDLPNALKQIGVPFSIEDGVPRIWGHLRKGLSPKIVSQLDG